MSKVEELERRLRRIWRELVDRLGQAIPTGQQPKLAPRRVRRRYY